MKSAAPKLPEGWFSARRAAALLVLLALAAATAAGLGNGLVACGAPGKTRDVDRPVTAAQAARLAGMRYANFQDGRVGVRAVVGTQATGMRLTGWIDWQHPLLYLNGLTPTPSANDALVQGTPALVAVRQGRTATGTAPGEDPYPGPPPVPPGDGWRVRPLASPGTPLDTLVELLFAVASTTPDDAPALRAAGARFVRADTLGGVPVELIDGPAIPPPAASPTPAMLGPRANPTGQPSASKPGAPAGMRSASPSASPAPFAALGGQVRYWLDAQGRVRRLDALLASNLPVEVDFRRDDHTVPTAIQPLGGAAIAPRPITPAEAALLAALPVRDRAARGGPATLSLPTGAGGRIEAQGWLDWRTNAAYLAVHDLDDESQDALLWADRSGVTSHVLAAPAPATSDGVPASPRPTPSVAPTGKPPVHPPAGGWSAASWDDRSDEHGATDLDLLLAEAIVAAAADPEDQATLRESASWLRTDSVSGVPVTVFEVRTAAEAGLAPGLGRLRYWVDASGLLRRLEVRTRATAFGYLDVVPGTVPALTRPA